MVNPETLKTDDFDGKMSIINSIEDFERAGRNF